MGKIQCDVCGGPLAIDAGGRSATCKNCGMEHSIERVREMLGTAPAAQPDPPAPEPQAEILDAGWVEIGEDGEEKRSAQPFCMTVDDILHIRGRGVVVSGFAEGGPVRVGDTVTIVGKKTGQRRDAVVSALNRFDAEREMFCDANAATPGAGAHVQLLLAGVGKKEVETDDTVVGR